MDGVPTSNASAQRAVMLPTYAAGRGRVLPRIRCRQLEAMACIAESQATDAHGTASSPLTRPSSPLVDVLVRCQALPRFPDLRNLARALLIGNKGLPRLPSVRSDFPRYRCRVRQYTEY